MFFDNSAQLSLVLHDSVKRFRFKGVAGLWARARHIYRGNAIELMWAVDCVILRCNITNYRGFHVNYSQGFHEWPQPGFALACEVTP